MEQKYCQSCGMPIDEQTFGSESNGLKNENYCHYCYEKGQFTANCTMEEMIAHCAEYVDEYNKTAEVKVTKEEAIENMRKFFPHLKRWKH